MSRNEKPSRPLRRREPEKLVTAAELADVLKVSVFRVGRLRKLGTIPAVKLGPKTFRYSVSKVLERIT